MDYTAMLIGLIVGVGVGFLAGLGVILLGWLAYVNIHGRMSRKVPSKREGNHAGL